MLYDAQEICDGTGLGPFLEWMSADQVLFNCVTPTTESSFGDRIDTDVQAAVGLAKDRIEWN